MLRIEGKWISTGLTLTPGTWREANGIECEYGHDYFSVSWAAHPPGLDREAGFREMEEALRRRAVAHAFELNGFLDITVGKRNDSRGYADLTLRANYTDSADLSRDIPALAPMATEPVVAEAMFAFTESCAGRPYPLARMYWAVDVLADHAGGKKQLWEKVRWSPSKGSRLTDALQYHRHPGHRLVLTEEECRFMTKELIVDYAASLRLPLR